MAELKDIIRKYRNDNNMTQKELADKSDISLRALSNYENGSRIPPLEIMIKMSNVLNIPLDELTDNVDIDDLQQIKNVILNKKLKIDKETMNLKDTILLTELLSKINEVQSTGSYTDMDIEIILNEFSLLLKRKVNTIDMLKGYIASKNYEITKLNDEILKDIDRKFSEILELEFFKLNK